MRRMQRLLSRTLAPALGTEIIVVSLSSWHQGIEQMRCAEHTRCIGRLIRR